MRPLFSRLLLILAVLVVLTGIFFAGIFVGTSNRLAIEKITVLANKENTKPASVDFSPFWKTWSVLDEKYADSNSTSTATSSPAESDRNRVWGAIGGMVDSLGDPYTVFLPPKEKELFEQEISGNFGGVGMEVGLRDGQLTVIAPLKDSPAIKAGVRAGDKIIKIDDRSAVGLGIEEGISLIRGEKGTKVTLTLLREREKPPIVVTIVRDIINVPTVETETITRQVASTTTRIFLRKVFIIHLYNFNAASVNAFREALREFVLAKTDRLIIDLRGNPGGYLEAAVEMASWFLPAGKTVVIERSRNVEHDRVFRSRGYDIFTDKLKLIIIVDKGSASASEILAGALAEHGRATLVGEQTFGKGSVQELVPITDDSSLKVTVARWLTPRGKSISHGGLTPDILASSSTSTRRLGEPLNLDPQLEKAVQVVLDK